MALEATHLRFALELKKKFGVMDLGKYILGTSYPDSRYMTGIDRELTHNNSILTKKFSIENDFKKGWQVHQICDLIQYKSFLNKVTLLSGFGKEWIEDKWVHFTAAKIVQDIIDRQAFDIKNYLVYLEHAENPNGEDLEKINRFNGALIEQYSHEISLDIYYKTLVVCGVGDDLAKKASLKADELQTNAGFITQINEVFSDMVQNYNQIQIIQE